jgi:hypothetical protein
MILRHEVAHSRATSQLRREGGKASFKQAALASGAATERVFLAS